MIKTRTLSSLLLLIGLATSALPSWAVSYDSTWSAYRYNSAGTTFFILPTNYNHFCYLSRVGVRETDSGGELARCTVRRSGAVWVLEAYLGTSSDADIQCSAICYNN